MDPPSRNASITAAPPRAVRRDPLPLSDSPGTRVRNQLSCTWNPGTSGLAQHPAIHSSPQPTPRNPHFNTQDLHFWSIYLTDRVLSPERVAQETSTLLMSHHASRTALVRGHNAHHPEDHPEHIRRKLSMLETHAANLFPGPPRRSPSSPPTSPLSKLKLTEKGEEVVTSDEEWDDALTANALAQRERYGSPPSTPSPTSVSVSSPGSARKGVGGGHKESVVRFRSMGDLRRK